MNSKLFILLAYIIVFASCGKSTQESAEQSLIGQWSISKIIEVITTSNMNGQSDQESITYEMIEGDFVFTADRMEYEYQTASMQSLEQGYTLDISKENAGFTKVNVFTVNGDQENYRVRFGDETNDAHENASEIALEQIISLDSTTISRFIELIRK